MLLVREQRFFAVYTRREHFTQCLLNIVVTKSDWVTQYPT